MARKQASPLKIGGILGGIAALLLIGVGSFLLLKKDDSFSKLPGFPVDAYLKGENLWSNSDYILSGRVDNVIYRSRDLQRIIASIQPSESRLRLPLVIETPPGSKSIQLEQELLLKVTLGPNREIICREYRSL